MKQRRCTDALVKRTNEVTSHIFKQSVIEVFNAFTYDETQLQDLIYSVRRASLGFVMYDMNPNEIQDLMDKKEQIDTLYLNKMITLPTDKLADILFLHERQRPERAERTIEAITSELARRSILNDSSQSDAIYTNGDVDVDRKDKTASKKASGKKHKTIKSR